MAEDDARALAWRIFVGETPPDGHAYTYGDLKLRPSTAHGSAWRAVDPDGKLVDLFVPARFPTLSALERYIESLPAREATDRPPEPEPDATAFQ